jgi:hypothetical protein
MNTRTAGAEARGYDGWRALYGKLNLTMADLPIPKRSRISLHDSDVAKNVSLSDLA